MYFTDSNEMHKFEREMRGVPFFGKRMPWDDIESCRECRNYNSQIRDCMDEHCPYLKRKLRSNSVVTKDMFETFLLSISYEPFNTRLKATLEHMKGNKLFLNKPHRVAFLDAVSNSDVDDYNYLAGIYILTMYPQLWKNFKQNNYCIRLNANLIDERLRTIIRFNKQILAGEKYLTLRYISDEDFVSDREFIYLCNAILVRRFGVVVLKIGG